MFEEQDEVKLTCLPQVLTGVVYSFQTEGQCSIRSLMFKWATLYHNPFPHSLILNTEDSTSLTVFVSISRAIILSLSLDRQEAAFLEMISGNLRVVGGAFCATTTFRSRLAAKRMIILFL